MTELTTLIFDMDGTLADTEEVHRQAFNLAFDDFNLDWHWSRDEYADLLAISGGRERMRQYALDHANFKLPPDLDSYVAGIHKTKTNHYMRMLVEGHVKLRPGVLRLLMEARDADMRLAIATSSQLKNVTTLLDNNLPADWPAWFEVIATCDIIEEKKPSPAVYEYVMQEMRVEPQECVAFEDTFNGFMAGHEAGIQTVITTHFFTQGKDFTGSPLVLDSLGEPESDFSITDVDPAIASQAEDTGHVDLALLKQITLEASPIEPFHQDQPKCA